MLEDFAPCRNVVDSIIVQSSNPPPPHEQFDRHECRPNSTIDHSLCPGRFIVSFEGHRLRHQKGKTRLSHLVQSNGDAVLRGNRGTRRQYKIYGGPP